MKDTVQKKLTDLAAPLIAKLTEPINVLLLSLLAKPIAQRHLILYQKVADNLPKAKEASEVARFKKEIAAQANADKSDFDKVIAGVDEVAGKVEAEVPKGAKALPDTIKNQVIMLFDKAMYTMELLDSPSKVLGAMLLDSAKAINTAIKGLIGSLIVPKYTEFFKGCVDQLALPEVPEAIKEYIDPIEIIQSIGINVITEVIDAMVMSEAVQKEIRAVVTGFMATGLKVEYPAKPGLVVTSNNDKEIKAAYVPRTSMIYAAPEDLINEEA